MERENISFDWEPITLEDARSVISVLERSECTRANTVPAEAINIVKNVATRIEEIDLEAMASNLAGVFDPIGQLQSWLQSQLNALVSWFSRTVDSIFRSIWSTVIKPYLSIIEGGVNWLKSSLSNLVSDISSSFSKVLSNISSLASSVSTILSKVTNLPSTIWNYIQSAINSIVSSISRTVGSAINQVTSAFSHAINFLLSFDC